MPAGPYSRYRNLAAFDVIHESRGRTRSLPVRRAPVDPSIPPGSRTQRYASHQTADMLALKFYGSEDLYWFLMDYNGRRFPESLEIGELIVVPSLDQVTRVDRKGR